MAKYSFMQIMSHDSPGTLVLYCERYWRNCNRVTPDRASSTGGV